MLEASSLVSLSLETEWWPTPRPAALRSIKAGFEPARASVRQSGMDRIEPSAEEQIASIIASAAKQPLLDAAFELWCRRFRLDSIEGRPTDEEVRFYRTLTPQQLSERLKYERDHAHEGPMFSYVKRAHPNAEDDAIRQAIVTAVKFEGAAEAHFDWNGDFWDCVVRAVAQAAAKYPDYLETTYRDARNNLAYYMK